MRRRSKLVVAGAVLLAFAVPIAALAATRGKEASAAPSYRRDVAPILQAKCEGCHRLGGIAPFSLESAHAAKTWSQVISAAVKARLMPPWPPGSDSPAYVGQSRRILTAAERQTILAWAKSGGKVDGAALKAKPPAPVPVRPGESIVQVAMPSRYKPKAPNGGTDDYRCFLLDPKLAQSGFVTSARIVPGATREVHHVILYREDSTQVAEAKKLDAASPGPGWTCFGGTGISAGAGSGSVQDFLNDANWIAAWAPGWGGDRLPDGNGIPLPAGSQIVMQVHYNLLNGRAADRSRAVLTVAPGTTKLTPVRTMLLPAPVELACAKSEHGRLCNRTEALLDLTRKYGNDAAFVPAGLLLLCGKNAASPRPSAVSTCDRHIDQPTRILAVAGHMHLLGQSIKLELDPGTPRARVLLDIPSWNFHWQNAYTLAKPVETRPGDVVRVTCRYDVSKRVRARQLGGPVPTTPRYVLWGEGTTDEMCLGILQVTSG
ncbi:MAG TPA: hypothetical protein VFK76_11545 [Gaiellaceae bacterium]|nr:hypothetical protein [Gaiellaceae bacterium]